MQDLFAPETRRVLGPLLPSQELLVVELVEVPDVALRGLAMAGLCYLSVTSRERYADDISKAMTAALEPETQEVYMGWIEQIEERGLERGLEQGLEKGREEAGRALLFRLLERRFGPLVEPARTRVEAAEPTTQDTWIDRIFEATTLDELLGPS